MAPQLVDQDSVVRALCAVWSEVLGVDVEADDDFFELGGYSLLIVTVVAQAREHGITITATDVFERKTPAAIAAGLARPSPTMAGDPDFATVWATGRSPLDVEPDPTVIPLTDPGTGRPVFCFHWGAGNVRFLKETMDSVRGDRAVYGVESVGLWNRERPPLSMVEMATRYLREIRTIQPTGPYLLVGPCAGGRVAYEIARQLTETGETVELLALLNTMPPGATDLDPAWGPADYYDFRLASLRDQFQVTSLTAGGDQLIAALVATGKVDAEMDPADLHWRQAVWAAGIFAQEHYEPRRYNGAVTVFQLKENAHLPEADWRRVAEVDELHTVDAADTLPLLRDPAVVEELRARLAACAP
ncbi:thioesterase domain-containing protein [Actinokineospora fastidiosa]|uniref:Carrier domain-containing protein n=1 Tax=Actinokineospora fastidiosa TaxID=1816 RepID=A0A918LC48_9PSEU|nr:thioesterase domain-containing protein [Actinokineospora fastidiosa]GGS28860.1 hypothetical protein GCM10010171_22510 [Actinokineospora fastidiosa]